jgi:N-acetylglucosaminyldiphosphoundecaprenol N-acetyl-beta-D-mannosaminyltransferase
MTTTPALENPFMMRSILGVKIAVSSYDEVVRQSLLWASQQRSSALFFAAVHMVMEAHDHPDFLPVLNGAGTVFPDGMPVVWALRTLGDRKAKRICGTDTTVAVLAAAEKAGLSVGFYGASQATLDALVKAVQLRHPNLNIAYAESPPFRPLTAEEDAEVVERINASGARLLFIGLGCPKQERWIVDHLDQVPAVMFAVGAAFDFIAGNKSRGPKWMSRNGLEWVYRFISEPRRLGVRYLKHNPRFVLLFLRQLLARSA